MVSTRADSMSKRLHGTSPLDGGRRSHRILRELQIDGTTALRGGKIERKAGKSGEVRNFRGGRYEIANDGISWKTTGSKRPASDDEAAPPPAAKRLRRDAAARCRKAVLTAAPSKKRRLDDDIAARDADYLAETVQRLKRAKVPSQSSRQAELRMMLPYLKKLEPVGGRRIERQAPQAGRRRGYAPDAYVLDSPAAQALFRSTEPVCAPVFLTGQKIPILDPENDARPIEQVFPWLDMDEGHDVADLQKEAEDHGGRFPERSVTTAEIRERFVNDNQEQAYPWNFLEIPLPTVAESMPDFLRHPNCNMMRDILRFIQSPDIDDICPATCPNHGKTAERCQKHLLTADEVVVLNQVYRHWLGTIMIAEAGALTQPHFDTFGFGTFICCAEGEIGFAWTSEATARKKGVSARDRLLFKVLRPGDAVYMDPGRYHLVFRLPGGKQTMGSSPRVLRYGDVERWLDIISLELQNAIDNEPLDDSHILVWRGLVMGTRYLITQARKGETFEKFGGEKTVRGAEKLLDKIEKQLQKLL